MDAEKMAEYCLIAAVGAATMLTVMFWGTWLVVIGAWVLAFPFALLLGLISGFVGHAMGVQMHSTDDDDGDIEDIAQVWTDEAGSMILERSVETIGTFQDAPIHEWVLLKRPDNDEPIRLVYNRVIDMRNAYTFEPPDDEWFCILPPGIMYVEPENSDTPASDTM